MNMGESYLIVNDQTCLINIWFHTIYYMLKLLVFH